MYLSLSVRMVAHPGTYRVCRRYENACILLLLCIRVADMHVFSSAPELILLQLLSWDVFDHDIIGVSARWMIQIDSIHTSTLLVLDVRPTYSHIANRQQNSDSDISRYHAGLTQFVTAPTSCYQLEPAELLLDQFYN